MQAKNSETLNAKGTEISIVNNEHFQEDYISLTDIAKYKNADFPADVVKNWLRVRSTIEYLGLWEQMHNPDFKLVEFDQFRKEAGLNAFVLSPQRWMSSTNAVGITSKSGRYGGTYAHSDIARLQKLRGIAYYQLRSLETGNITNKLKQNIQNKLEQK